MNWLEILRLVLAILKILDMLPKEKKKDAETKVFGAVAKLIEENNIA